MKPTGSRRVRSWASVKYASCMVLRPARRGPRGWVASHTAASRLSTSRLYSSRFHDRPEERNFSEQPRFVPCFVINKVLERSGYRRGRLTSVAGYEGRRQTQACSVSLVGSSGKRNRLAGQIGTGGYLGGEIIKEIVPQACVG
jgi:hypothetical protein